MHTFFYLHNLPYSICCTIFCFCCCVVPCRVSVSFFVVCSSMKLHWFRNFIILHKIMRLCCLLASLRPLCVCVCVSVSRFRSFRHRETPFHPLLFIFVTMNCKAMYMKTFLLHLVFFCFAVDFFHYILLFSSSSFLFIFEVHLPQFYRRCCCCCCSCF